MHTLALAEALAGPGVDVTVWTLGRGGEATFFRPVDPAVRLAVVPFPDVPEGTVAHDDLPGLVAAAGAFAFPATKEGFGMAAMEAPAAGVPVVTRDLPVLREVFDGAARFATDPPTIAAALLDPPADDDPATRTAGRELAARHTWQAAARQHVELYRAVSTT